jgi:hypothetical protein
VDERRRSRVRMRWPGMARDLERSPTDRLIDPLRESPMRW